MRAADYEYIAAHRHEMSERQLAEALRLSKTTVHRAIKRLGLMTGGECPRPAPAPAPAAPEAPERAADRLVLLHEISAALRASMKSASATALPAITKEYRATLDQIAEIEGAPGAPAEPEEPKKEAKVTAFNAIRSSRPPFGKAAEV